MRRNSFEIDNVLLLSQPKLDIKVNDMKEDRKDEAQILETESENEVSLYEVKSQSVSKSCLEPLLSVKSRSLSSGFDDDD